VIKSAECFRDSLVFIERQHQELCGEVERLRSSLETIMHAAARIKRGCHCDYDHRWGNCQAVLNLQELVESAKVAP
jgi:hypothetical protein